jgi:polysaccharide biosynthesis/export protein
MRIHTWLVLAAFVAGTHTAGAQSSGATEAPRPATGSANASSAPGTTGTTGTTGTAPSVPTAEKPAFARADMPDYRISPGDKLRIEVYRDQQLSQSLQVRPDGKVTLPLLGDLQASGLTPIELRDQIGTSLKEYVTNPVVTVIVTEAVAPTVFVMGEVNNPGSIAMQGPLSVMQALAMAGGFKDFANTKNIRILRHSKRGTQTVPFNYKDALKGEGEVVMLAPGDTVIVP